MGSSSLSHCRPVHLLGAGGTISMRGPRAVPALDARALADEVPALAELEEFSAETVFSSPGVHLTPEQALTLASRAAERAAGGAGVVITTGTDTLDEIAVLTAFLHGAAAPIAITGANRPAGSPGADGPANLLDAVALAGAEQAEGLGTVVVFGGEIHSAMSVRKVDSTGPAAFGSPSSGPLGRVVAGRVWLSARPVRPPTLRVASLDHRVEVIYPALGDDGSLLRRATEGADGIVLVAFGAGHVTEPLLPALREAVFRMPVVVTCRPDRSSMLIDTYGFQGAEADVRASGAVAAPFLSPQAARMALLACLGAGLDAEGIRGALSAWDVG